MKRIRKYIAILGFFVMGMAVTGCGGKKTSDVPSDSTTHETTALTDSVATKDSVNRLNMVMLDSIGKMNKALTLIKEKAESDHNTLQSRVDGLNMAVWALGGFCVLCLLLCFIVVMWCKKLKEQGISHRNQLQDIKKSMRNDKIEASSGVSQPSYLQYKKLEDRIQTVENVVGALSRVPSTGSSKPATVKPTTAPRPIQPQPQEKIEKKVVKAYFGNPVALSDKEGYFRKVLESLDSDARFVAEISDENAMFTPILDSEAAKKTLLTSDQMKLAVEFSGCTPAEMKSMKVLTKGEAKKNENDRWVITRKARILLM